MGTNCGEVFYKHESGLKPRFATNAYTAAITAWILGSEVRRKSFIGFEIRRESCGGVAPCSGKRWSTRETSKECSALLQNQQIPNDSTLPSTFFPLVSN